MDPERVQALLRERANDAAECVVVEDLCGLAATNPAALRLSVSQASAIIACHARAVRWLLHFAGAPVEGVTLLNARVSSPA